MQSIMTTYPDFQSLPREVKKLLLVSENYFFQEDNAHHGSPATPAKVAHWETSTKTHQPQTLVITALPQPPTYDARWAA